jgi:hypothetical protein
LRKPKKIDFDTVEKLCAIQCTGEEIAGVLGIDYDTLNARIKEEYNISFSEYFKQKRQNGRASLRRLQWKKAEQGDTTMLIWLGKNYLQQTDKQEIEHSGNVGVTIKDDV